MPYADLERQRAYKRKWMQMRRAGECGTPGGTTLPVSFRVQTAADVLDLLSNEIEAVRGDPEAKTLEKARVVGYLAGIALRAVEVAQLSGRVEALEAVLKARRRPA
jgi:hypothetical protein